jgi:hypothetical protein
MEIKIRQSQEQWEYCSFFMPYFGYKSWNELKDKNGFYTSLFSIAGETRFFVYF